MRGRVLGIGMVAAFLCLMVAEGMADVIRLRDGSVLRGRVVSYKQRQFTIEVYIGGSVSQHVVAVEDVESVEFDGQGGAVARSTEPTERVTSGDGGGRSVSPAAPTGAGAEKGGTGAGAGRVEEVAATNTVIAEKTVTVAAAADWTSTEIRVQRGQRIVITASGEADLGEGQRTGPAGTNTADPKKLMQTGATGALIAVIGDDNDDFIFVGSSSEFNAPHNGILFLSLNEGNLRDNSGSFVVRVRVLSNR